MTRLTQALVFSVVMATGLYAATAPKQVCWSRADGAEQCVPLSIVQATFTHYQAGQASPLAIEQSSHLETLDTLRAVEGELSACRRVALAGVKQDLLRSVQGAAPEGDVWDPKIGRYVRKE